jgi:hypothetical protein
MQEEKWCEFSTLSIEIDYVLGYAGRYLCGVHSVKGIIVQSAEVW